MEGQGGHPTDDLSERFGRADAAPDFFFAVRVAQARHPELPAIGTAPSPRAERVRFAQHVSLSFPSRTLADTSFDRSGRLRFAVSSMGLLGPAGPLPIHLVQIARRRGHPDHDGALIAFLDMFNHRMISLLFRAHAVNRLTMSSERPEYNQYRRYISAAAGHEQGWGADDSLDDAALYFAGRLCNQTRHPEGLVSILHRYFDCAVRIQEFVPSLVRIPEESWTRLGGSPESASLGRSAFVGSVATEVQHKVRITLGPLTLSQYERLLPVLCCPGEPPTGGIAAQRLGRWVSLYLGDSFDYEVELLLDREERPPAYQGREAMDDESLQGFGLGRYGRVGRTQWLGCRKPDGPVRGFVQRCTAAVHERSG